jgi:tetratricopeptide (TPR) repeat protein
VKPEIPPAKPEVSTAKPEVSTAKPEVSTAKPEASTAKTEPAATRPRTTEAKSEVAQAKPGASETKPRTSETKSTPPRKPETKPAPPPQIAAAAPPVKQLAAPERKPGLTAEEIANRLAVAERALNAAQLPEARRTFRELLDAPGLERESLLRVSEGLYRARDFAGALAAFKALGPLRRGEEPYGYYQAVSYYETGAYEAAKKELAAALPFIEMTPDVFRYRAKIEGSR